MKLEFRKYVSLICLVLTILGWPCVGSAKEIRLSPHEYWQISEAFKEFQYPSDETLKNFSRQMEGKNVFRVAINDASRITDVGMAALAKLPIKELDITQGTFNGKCLSLFRDLCILRLYGCTRLTDDGLAAIQQIPGLVDLTIYYAPQITPSGFAKIAEIKQLQKLDLCLDQLDDSWFLLQNLDDLSDLKTLSVTGRFGKDIFKAISHFPDLNSISVSQWVHKAGFLIFLIPGLELPKLTEALDVYVWDWQEIITPLGELQHLEHLEILGNIIINGGENRFFPPNFAKLKSFAVLSDTMEIPEIFLEKMYDAMPGLEALNLPVTPLTGKALLQFMERNPALDIGISGKRAIEYAKEVLEE